ncbi:hypothetical protein [Pelagibaculum spongiae]|uniref:Uncharacterized protein n=1 Tax=Pelagibaculum spongiae TaxID=2080658 RepID=A0A2V1H5B6_9GAMM|nr:hypothetical protein [Pelagibaculum spongiae]PVZ72448.1 hypothetical protein DC094_05435 [Pelagibaculum spongiae]
MKKLFVFVVALVAASIASVSVAANSSEQVAKRDIYNQSRTQYNFDYKSHPVQASFLKGKTVQGAKLHSAKVISTKSQFRLDTGHQNAAQQSANNPTKTIGVWNSPAIQSNTLVADCYVAPVSEFTC